MSNRKQGPVKTLAFYIFQGSPEISRKESILGTSDIIHTKNALYHRDSQSKCLIAYDIFKSNSGYEQRF